MLARVMRLYAKALKYDRLLKKWARFFRAGGILENKPGVFENDPFCTRCPTPPEK
jgi:hypothetical protein